MTDRRRTHRRQSPAEIEAAARINPEDIRRAAAAYRRHAPRALSTLLDAPPERGEATNRPTDDTMRPAGETF